MASSYFSHDSNARNSKKLIRLRQAHGAAGYGIYFMLLERLREEGGYTSDRDYDMIAYDLREPVDLIRSVVEDFDLFEISDDGKLFRSKGLVERMELREIRAEAGRKGATGRWCKPYGKTDGKILKESEKRSKNNNNKNSENMAKSDTDNPAQNGKEWQNDSKSSVLPMALNKSKDKRKEINKEKSFFLELKNKKIEVPFAEQPDTQVPWTLEMAIYMAWQLHMPHPYREAQRLVDYNMIHNAQAKNWDLEQWCAAARLWQPTDKAHDTRWDDIEWTIFWEKLFVTLADKKEYNLMKQALGANIVPGYVEDGEYALVVTEQLYEFIERQLDDLSSPLGVLIQSKGLRSKNLFYKLVNDKL